MHKSGICPGDVWKTESQEEERKARKVMVESTTLVTERITVFSEKYIIEER